MPGACADTLWPNQAPTALGTAFALLARAFPGGGELLQARSLLGPPACLLRDSGCVASLRDPAWIVSLVPWQNGF
jgi:hypothetical protein